MDIKKPVSQAELDKKRNQPIIHMQSSYTTHVASVKRRLMATAGKISKEMKRDVNDDSYIKHIHRMRAQEEEHNQMRMAVEDIKRNMYSESARDRHKDTSRLM